MKKKRKFGEPKIWEKPKIKIEFVDEEMTSSSTTGTLIDLFSESPQFLELKNYLPKRISNNSYPTEVFALSLLEGFLHGHDSIDDQIEFDEDPGIESVIGETPKARAMGDWMRDFEDENILGLQQFLHLQAMGCRKN